MGRGILGRVSFPVAALDGLEGDWHLEGTVLGRPLVQDVTVEWILQGAYLCIHYQPSTVTPMTEDPYEAIAYIGWDPGESGFVMLLFDTFGAAYPTPGIGAPLGNGAWRFDFAYPQGRFVTDFHRDGTGWRIEQFSTADNGELVPFAVKQLDPRLTERE